jgi:hypothetical protein
MIREPELFYRVEDEGNGGDILDGVLRRANDGPGWQVAGVDLNEYLARYLGYKIMVIVASAQAVPEEETEQYACSKCGFPLDEMGVCVQCGWHAVAKAKFRMKTLFQQIDQIVEQCWAGPGA